MKIQVHQVLISLLIGLALGWGVSRWQGPCFLPMPKQGDMKKHMMTKLSRELNLSADQKTKVEAIFDGHHPKMMALHEEMRPKFEVLKKEVHAEIRTVLDPEQQKKFEVFSAKMEERRKERREQRYKF